MSAVLPLEITYPFSINSAGTIGVTTDYVKTAEDHIVSVLGTRFGERVMRPLYGASVEDAFFSLAGANDNTVVINDVIEALTTWEPGIQVIDVNLLSLNPGDPESLVSINVSFRVVGKKTISDFNPIYTASIRVGGTIIESRNS
jgi:phage baseplate assembly protein W